MFIKRFLRASRCYLFSYDLTTSEDMVSTIVLPAPTEGLITGRTVVELSKRFISALDAFQLLFDRISPCKLENGVAAFPISAGTIDFANAKGEMLHLGGMSIGAGPVAVQLRDFSIDTTKTQPLLTGMVVVNSDLVGRMSLLDLELPRLDLPLDPQSRLVEIPNVKAKLTRQAARALNRVFGVNGFFGGMDFGTARISALTRPSWAPA